MPSRSWCFAVLLLLSGFCGISYEVLYARILSNVIGDQFAVSASILVTFMLGIGFGTLYAHRLWRFLWLIEGGIALFGVSFALGTPSLERLYYGTATIDGGLGGAMAFCFVLLAGPAFLIGCSLPLFAGYLGSLTSGPVFARAYMIYNFGAALTVLLIEFALFRWLGLGYTVLVMAALNAIVCVALLGGFSAVRSRPEGPPKPLGLPAGSWLALAVASIASAVFQLLMIKLAECFLGPFRETFALVLAVVLLGIALGSAVLRRFAVDLTWLLVSVVIGLVGLLLGYEWVTATYAALRPSAVEHASTYVLLRIAAIGALMGLPAIAFGATVPALLRRLGTVAHDSGQLLFVSSMGNAAGFVLMAFVLHRSFEYGVLIIVVGGLTCVALVLAKGGGGRALLAGLALLGLLIGAHRARWNEDLLYLSYDAFQSSEELDWYRREFVSAERFKGRQDVFSLTRIGSDVHFFINGYVSIDLESAAERIVGAFPALFAPRTDRAFILGVGSGITTGTVSLLFEHVDAVEINPVVLQNLHRMSAYNFGLDSRPNARLVVDDGLHFARVAPDRYSLIISTLTSPRYFSSSKLYTSDFFDTIRARLTPDGVYVTWIDSLVGQRGFDIMLKTATTSFRHCALAAVNSGYFLLLCSDEPIVLRRPDLAARVEPIASYLRQNGLRPDWLPYGFLTTRAEHAIEDATVPLNTMDHPVLEFQAARMADRDPDVFAEQLVERKLSLDDVASALRPSMGFDPMHLVLHTEQLMGPSGILDGWVALVEAEDPTFRSRHAAARLEYRREMAMDAGSADAHRLYAFDLLQAGRLNEAIEEGRKAVALDPDLGYAFGIIGRAQELAGDLDSALASFEQALKINGTDVESGLGIGRVFYGRMEYARALEALERAEAESQEPHAELFRYLGLVYEAMGRKRDAARARRNERLVLDLDSEAP